MAICPKCDLEYDDGAAFCAQCGGKLGDAAQVNVPAPEDGTDAHRLLAEAHLLRLRHEWDTAIERCTRALRIEPSNAEAHSLLARVYQDKGDLDEAVRWYEMALDLDPANRADRDALSALQEIRGRRRAAEAAAAGSEGDTWFDRALRDPRIRSFAGYAAAAVLAVVLALIIGALIKLLFQRPAQPISKPPTRQTETQSSLPQRQTLAQQPSAASAPSAPEYSARVRPMAEQQLLAQIRLYNVLTERGITVEDLMLDPRKRSATATFRMQTANPSKAEVVPDAAIVVLVLFQARPEMNEATVRAIASLPDEFGGQQWTLAFVGDTTRSRATSVDIANASTEKIAGMFRETYYHGGVK